MNILAKVLEHNNWANLEVIRACSSLGEDQLDAVPRPGEQWSIRKNLVHLVACQQEYLSDLTDTPATKSDAPPTFADLEESAVASGDGLLTLARPESAAQFERQLHSSDGYRVEPWVVMVQAVNHGAEHRKQIVSLMRALGLAPPRLDGWAFGETLGAVIPPAG